MNTTELQQICPFYDVYFGLVLLTKYERNPTRRAAPPPPVNSTHRRRRTYTHGSQLPTRQHRRGALDDPTNSVKSLKEGG